MKKKKKNFSLLPPDRVWQEDPRNFSWEAKPPRKNKKREKRKK